jgi:glycosyltransferase involved in cell wall biosynthesis
MVGRLDRIKDHRTLVKALTVMIHRWGLPVHLHLIGEGPLEAELRAMCADLDVKNSVTFLGGRSDVENLLGTYDVFVFSTTRDEGFGIALIEAMAAGLPIVASDVPATREVLSDGLAGVLVPPGDESAMAEAVMSLMAAPDAARALGCRAQERAKGSYDVEACAELWLRHALGKPEAREPHWDDSR